MLQEAPTLQDYTLAVKLKELLGKELFSEDYQIRLQPDFVANTEPKQHGFKNHVHGFVVNLKQNSAPQQKTRFAKWQLYVVSYGMNTGSEINGDRPSIIYKANHSTLGDDVIVIPLTSAVAQKQADKYDVFVQKDAANKLFQNSYARLRQIRSVSVKRVSRAIGQITDQKLIQQINDEIKKMLATEN